jgi:hypothetical protein
MVANTGTYLDSPFHRYADGDDIAALQLEQLAHLDGVVADVRDGALLLQSKVDQEAHGAVVGVPNGERPDACPVRTLADHRRSRYGRGVYWHTCCGLRPCQNPDAAPYRWTRRPHKWPAQPTKEPIMALRGIDGKVAVVTGGAGGLGAAAASRLASEGARLVLVDIDGEAAEAAANRPDPAPSASPPMSPPRTESQATFRPRSMRTAASTCSSITPGSRAAPRRLSTPNSNGSIG